MAPLNALPINTATTTTLGGTGSGIRLHAIIVGTGQTGATCNITDKKSGTQILTLTAATQGSIPLYGVRGEDGFSIVTAGATPANITIVYQ